MVSGSSQVPRRANRDRVARPNSSGHRQANLKRTERRVVLAQLLYAQYHCVATMDEDLFKSLTGEIASSPAGVLPEAALLNAVARMKSKKLAENFDDLF